MKTKILNIIVFFLFCKIIFAQQYPCGMPTPIVRYNVPTEENYSNVEMRIYNQTNYYNREASGPIRVLITPVGTFFNKIDLYSPLSIAISSHTIAGKEVIIPEQGSSTSITYVSGNWDRSIGNTFESDFSYGYGKYKFEFYRWEEDTVAMEYRWKFSNYVYIDFRDIGPANGIVPDSANGSLADMRLDYFTKDTITYQFDARHVADEANFKYKFWHINLVNKELKVWDKYGTCIPPLIPDRGTFYPENTNPAYLKWPLNANKYNGNIGQENPGELGMNLEINHDVSTQDTLITNPTNILIPKQGYLKIASGKTFEMKTALSPSLDQMF